MGKRLGCFGEKGEICHLWRSNNKLPPKENSGILLPFLTRADK